MKWVQITSPDVIWKQAEKTGNEGVSLCLIVSVGMEGQARKVSKWATASSTKGWWIEVPGNWRQPQAGLKAAAWRGLKMFKWKFFGQYLWDWELCTRAPGRSPGSRSSEKRELLKRSPDVVSREKAMWDSTCWVLVCLIWTFLANGDY